MISPHPKNTSLQYCEKCFATRKETALGRKPYARLYVPNYRICSTLCRLQLYSRSLSVTFCGVWSSHGTPDQDIDRPMQLLCLWPQNLEPTTVSPPTARTVAVFIQVPAQDPPLPALVCWL